MIIGNNQEVRRKIEMKMIHQQVEEEVIDYLMPLKNEYVEQCLDIKLESGWYDNDRYMVEAWGYYKNEYNPEEKTEFILLRLYINHGYKQIHITNIFLPDFMKYKGIGKKLIHKIFMISKNVHYGLFIVDMVNSFYQRMIKRGALPCKECDDAVQIISETKLF